MSLQYDPLEAVAALAAQDRRLARLMERAGPFHLPIEKLQSPFQALFKAIVYQQLSGKAAATILSRVKSQFPGRHGLSPAAVLAAQEENLRQAGMSRAKIAAVRDLAAKTIDGTVPGLARLRKMSDEEILSRLVSVRGVGTWTVEMLLMFQLGRPDVMPVSDLGVRRGFMLTYRTPEMPKPNVILKQAERWRPYRSVASWYLWRAVDLDRRANAIDLRNPTSAK